MAPFGLALTDFLAGDPSATLTVRRDDGFAGGMPVALFFRGPEDFSPLDRAALDLCRTPVLDAGAGAGVHSLALQDRGVTVTAIDVCAAAVEVMRRRGVRDVRVADVCAFAEGPFQTILMLQHGLGLAGTLEGLDRLLIRLRGRLAEDGEIVCDSLDVRQTEDPRHLAYQDANRRAGRYVGEVRTRIEYEDHVGPWYDWLHVDPDTLTAQAASAGYACTVAVRVAGGDYLARLRPRRSRA
ncbi:MAG: methyltransferase domain-containing protein [Planctomycetota bacterium]|jgi:SAM-dependent methyltransferase